MKNGGKNKSVVFIILFSVYTTVQTFGVFWEEIYCAYKGCIYLVKNTVKTSIL